MKGRFRRKRVAVVLGGHVGRARDLADDRRVGRARALGARLQRLGDPRRHATCRRRLATRAHRRRLQRAPRALRRGRLRAGAARGDGHSVHRARACWRARSAWTSSPASAVWQRVRLPTPEWRAVGADETIGASFALPAKLPLVVKPAAEGSSVGRVDRARARRAAAGDPQGARASAPDALVERYVAGKEVTVGDPRHAARSCAMEVVARGRVPQLRREVHAGQGAVPDPRAAVEASLRAGAGARPRGAPRASARRATRASICGVDARESSVPDRDQHAARPDEPLLSAEDGGARRHRLRRPRRDDPRRGFSVKLQRRSRTREARTVDAELALGSAALCAGTIAARASVALVGARRARPLACRASRSPGPKAHPYFALREIDVDGARTRWTPKTLVGVGWASRQGTSIWSVHARPMRSGRLARPSADSRGVTSSVRCRARSAFASKSVVRWRSCSPTDRCSSRRDGVGLPGSSTAKRSTGLPYVTGVCRIGTDRLGSGRAIGCATLARLVAALAASTHRCRRSRKFASTATIWSRSSCRHAAGGALLLARRRTRPTRSDLELDAAGARSLRRLSRGTGERGATREAIDLSPGRPRGGPQAAAASHRAARMLDSAQLASAARSLSAIGDSDGEAPPRSSGSTSARPRSRRRGRSARCGRAEPGVEIIGIGTAPSRGLRKGVVVNIEATVEAIRKAVEEAELMAGCEIHSVDRGHRRRHIRASTATASSR